MILGIGTDIVDLQEFERIFKEKSFFDHTFTTAEKKYVTEYSYSRAIEFYAGRFSVKESVSKALSSFINSDEYFDMRTIETLPDETGKPVVTISGCLADILKKHNNPVIHVSISHDRNYAISYVIIEEASYGNK